MVPGTDTESESESESESDTESESEWSPLSLLQGLPLSQVINFNSKRVPRGIHSCDESLDTAIASKGVAVLK